MELEQQRPNPDILLKSILSDEENKRGKLKIFFGYSAGVGKTYAMLDEAQGQLKTNADVLVGYVEPHTRPETLRLLEGLPALPPKKIAYKNMQMNEFDLDAALQRRPALILVDELAHTNIEGVRNKKRYQDVEELLNAGIDVYTTVNVQHIESLKDIVEEISGISVRETIPDYIFDNADKVKLIDIDPDELLKRFEEGKIYRPERAAVALQNFFTKENLRLLREIALRKTVERISQDNENGYSTIDKTINMRYLVCIGPSSSSEKCIRWTARTVEVFHAPWTALFIETPASESYNEEQNKNVRSNLDLAAKLGAQIVTLNGDDIASSVSEYAKLSGITNIVIGKSRKRKTLRSFFQTALEDKLILLLSNTEIHIIPDNDAVETFSKPKISNLRKNLYFSWGDTAKTVGMLFFANLLSFGLRAVGIGDQNVIMVFILSVLFISRITAGYFYGVTASILSVLTFNFFFIEPYFTFNAIQPGYPVTFIIMLLVALITSALMIRIKAQAKSSASKERNTEVLYEINKKLLVTRGLENIIDFTNDYITKIFKRSIIFYYDDPAKGNPGVLKQSMADTDSSFMLTPDEQAVAHWVFMNQKRAGNGTDTLMGAGAFYMPIISQGNVIGVLGLSCASGSKLNHNDRSFLRMIASLVAMALERQRLSDEQRKIQIESEKEKMRSNLLRAISHDLRTPLTGILGASSAILENKDTIDTQTHDKLLIDIKEDAQWLIRMVENLLSVTRISEGTMHVVKTPEAVEEIVAEAVLRIRNRFSYCNLTVKVPDELLLVPMDGTLIEQVIINLLENAIKHSPENYPIELTVKKVNNTAVFEVSDNGKGVPPQDLPDLFEGYIANKSKNSDSSRGMGIGLSICKSIINAHNGMIEAENKIDGGATFRFFLPLDGSNANGQ
jgi:two-component system, OmpR family, sensor histidine kinase KdpD